MMHKLHSQLGISSIDTTKISKAVSLPQTSDSQQKSIKHHQLSTNMKPNSIIFMNPESKNFITWTNNTTTSSTASWPSSIDINISNHTVFTHIESMNLRIKSQTSLTTHSIQFSLVLAQNTCTAKASFTSCCLTQIANLHHFSWLDLLNYHLSDSVVFSILYYFYLTFKSSSP